MAKELVPYFYDGYPKGSKRSPGLLKTGSISATSPSHAKALLAKKNITRVIIHKAY